MNTNICWDFEICIRSPLINIWKTKQCWLKKTPSRLAGLVHTPEKMKFSNKDFFSKCDQIRSFLRIWSHLLKKSLMENFIFCAVLLARVHMENFHLAYVRSRQNQVRTHLGGLARFSYEYIYIFIRVS